MGAAGYNGNADGVVTIDNTLWRFSRSQNETAETLRDELLGLAREAIAGRMGTPYHRSRQASTWQAAAGKPAILSVFVKLIEAPRGMARLKRTFKGSRGAHIERITQALNDAGFSAAPVLLRGVDPVGRELIITLQADGDGTLRTLDGLGKGPLARKWVMLQAFGRELARFHRCGFVHGDLTPFNLFFIRSEPLRFALIDNERTRRVAALMGIRPRLRNLVQLGRFALPHLSRPDRLRVLRAYTEMMSPPARRAVTRRVVGMLNRRIKRDGGLATVPTSVAILQRTTSRGVVNGTGYLSRNTGLQRSRDHWRGYPASASVCVRSRDYRC